MQQGNKILELREENSIWTAYRLYGPLLSDTKENVYLEQKENKYNSMLSNVFKINVKGQAGDSVSIV